MQLLFYGLIFCAAAVCWQQFSAPATQPVKVGPDALDGKTFRSVAEPECGLGQYGPVMRHWYLRFDPIKAGRPRTFVWDYSDVRSGGVYHLAEDGRLSVPRVNARYDPNHERVFWDGLWYERTKDRRG